MSHCDQQTSSVVLKIESRMKNDAEEYYQGPRRKIKSYRP